jgi:hypothetical protein
VQRLQPDTRTLWIPGTAPVPPAHLTALHVLRDKGSDAPPLRGAAPLITAWYMFWAWGMQKSIIGAEGKGPNTPMGERQSRGAGAGGRPPWSRGLRPVRPLAPAAGSARCSWHRPGCHNLCLPPATLLL